MINTIWLPVLIFVLSWVLTGLMRRYALARNLLDVPNARSSHVVPTPRGGGMAIVVSFLVALAVAVSSGGGEQNLLAALAGAGVGVALLGFLDDHGHVPARWRLLGHFAAAAWVLFWLEGISPSLLLGLSSPTQILDPLLAALFIVWMLNLYNFMDGIDGLAGIEAVTIGLGGALVAYLAGQENISAIAFYLAMAALGFLLWNFPPARIFMGDAGSGFLGVTVGVLMLYAGTTHLDLFWAWVILPAVFIADATVTLFQRLRRGERLYEAHRSHAYQHAARRYGSHLPVTVATGVINLGWLLPIAVAVVSDVIPGGLGVLLAYAPLVCLAHHFRAGRPD
jgi:Fuc2NAc and GlcNAc transferase